MKNRSDTSSSLSSLQPHLFSGIPAMVHGSLDTRETCAKHSQLFEQQKSLKQDYYHIAREGSKSPKRLPILVYAFGYRSAVGLTFVSQGSSARWVAARVFSNSWEHGR